MGNQPGGARFSGSGGGSSFIGSSVLQKDSADSTRSLESFLAASYPYYSPSGTRFGDGILLSTNNAGQIHAFDPSSDIDIPHIWTPPEVVPGAVPGPEATLISKIPQSQYYGICYLPTLNMVCFGGESSFAVARLSPDEVHIRPVQILDAHTNSATNCSFIPPSGGSSTGGGLLVTASFDHSFTLYDLTSIYGSEGPKLETEGEGGGVAKMRATVDGHNDLLYAIRWSPGWPERLLTGSCDDTAKVWDLATLKEVGVLSGHRGSVYGVELNETAEVLVTGSFDRTVRFWDSRTFQQIRSSDNSAQIWSSFWSNEKNLFVGGTYEGEVTIWDVRNMSEVVRRWNAHRHHSYIQGTTEIDEETFATASGDHHVKIWTYEGKEKKDYDVVSPSRAVCHVRVLDEMMDQRQIPAEDFERVTVLLENQDEELLEMCLWELAPGKMRVWAFLKGIVTEPRLQSVLFDAESSEEEVFLRLLLGDMSQIRTPLDLARHVRVLFEIGLTDVAYVLCTSGLSVLERVLKNRTSSESEAPQSAVERSQSGTMRWLKGLAEVLLEADEESTLVPRSFLACVRDAIAASRETETDFGETIDEFLRVRNLFDGISEHESQDLKQHPDFPEPPTVSTIQEAALNLRLASRRQIKEGSLGVVQLLAEPHSTLCHLDLMALRTEFFSRMLHFSGREVGDIKSTASVVLEDFDGLSLQMLTEWMYSDIIEIVYRERLRANLPPIFKLVQHSVTYGESRLRRSLVRVLVDLAKSITPRLLRKTVRTCMHFEDEEALLLVRKALSLEDWPRTET